MSKPTTEFTPKPERLPALSIEEFRALPKPEQRVAIARDAIAQIKEKRFIATSGTYFNLSVDLDQVGRELREIIAKGPPCQVCGIGACFASAVRLDDSLALAKDDVFGQHDHKLIGTPMFASAGKLGLSNGDKLGEFFDLRQLDLIECAFEESTDNASSLDLDYEDDEDADNDTEGADQEEAEKAVAFGENYGDDTDRLMAILQNVIDNAGEFIP